MYCAVYVPDKMWLKGCFLSGAFFMVIVNWDRKKSDSDLCPIAMITGI